jgi:GntR family transcriptional repressor for pyruvate dehydrogenase complex
MATQNSIRRPKLSDMVVDDLRAKLTDGKIPAGRKLPTETQLVERFGVSRTVVREAIARLAGDGLVESRHGAGVFALSNTHSDLVAIGAEANGKISIALNVLELRMAIEIESAALAAQRRNHAQDAGIEEAYMEVDRLIRLGEPIGRADFDFHQAIAIATNNPFYNEVLSSLGSRTIPCDPTSPWSTETTLSTDYQRRLQVEHMAIMTAISAGDPDAARQAMRAHLSASQARYRAQLRERTQSNSTSSLPLTRAH